MTAVIDAAQTTEDDALPIECTAAVYLHWDAEREAWGVAPSTMDGYGLDWTGDGITTDLVEGYDAHSPAKQAEWDDAEAAPMPTGVELFAQLGLAAVCYDGSTQGLMRQLHESQTEAASALQEVDDCADGYSNDEEFVALGGAVEALQGALDAAMALLRHAGLVSEEAQGERR